MIPPMGTPLIIIGASARAAAASAKAAGFEPWCIDLFADRDLRSMAEAVRCSADRWPDGVIDHMKDAPPGAAVLFTGAMENHPAVVEAVLADRDPLGASAQAMAAAREPATLAQISDAPGLGHCRIIDPHALRGRVRLALARLRGQRMVVKPRRSAGGAHMHFDNGSRIARNCYLQQFIEGDPIAAAYHSDGWSVRLLGVMRQLLDGFRYVGSVGPLAINQQVRDALTHVGLVLAQQCDLRGCFGVDAIIDSDRTVWPIEVNPRWTASMELFERAHGISLLAPPAKAPRQPRGILAKRIVFAQNRYVAPDLYDHFAPHDIADVPEVGQVIEPHRPICTVFAEGADVADCESRLHARAETVYTHSAHDA